MFLSSPIPPQRYDVILSHSRRHLFCASDKFSDFVSEISIEQKIYQEICRRIEGGSRKGKQ